MAEADAILQRWRSHPADVDAVVAAVERSSWLRESAPAVAAALQTGNSDGNAAVETALYSSVVPVWKECYRCASVAISTSMGWVNTSLITLPCRHHHVHHSAYEGQLEQSGIGSCGPMSAGTQEAVLGHLAAQGFCVLQRALLPAALKV